MISSQKITTSEVRKYNKNRIFKLIYNSSAISRQEIADTLGLSLPTINQNIKLLKDSGLIVMEGSFDSTGGRKAQMIMVNADARFAISVNVRANELKVALIDLNGEIRSQKSVDIEFSPESDYGVKVSELVDDIIEENNINTDNILGIGITMPGIFNSDNTMIISSPPLNTRDYKTDNITSRLKYDYTVQNDARASAFADYWYSHKNENAHMDESYHDKFYLMINDGVGGACVSNDKIVQGEHNRYGEFGHMTLYPDGRKCMCGKKGCVESYLSARNLSSDLGIQIDEFFKKASEGDAQCVKVLDEYLDNLTTGINNLYVIFDRDIVIGGFVSRYLLEYEENIRQRLTDKYSFDTDGRYFSISSCTSERTDTGAAIMFCLNSLIVFNKRDRGEMDKSGLYRVINNLRNTITLEHCVIRFIMAWCFVSLVESFIMNSRRYMINSLSYVKNVDMVSVIICSLVLTIVLYAIFEKLQDNNRLKACILEGTLLTGVVLVYACVCVYEYNDVYFVAGMTLVVLAAAVYSYSYVHKIYKGYISDSTTYNADIKDISKRMYITGVAIVTGVMTAFISICMVFRYLSFGSPNFDMGLFRRCFTI